MNKIIVIVAMCFLISGCGSELKRQVEAQGIQIAELSVQVADQRAVLDSAFECIEVLQRK